MSNRQLLHATLDMPSNLWDFGAGLKHIARPQIHNTTCSARELRNLIAYQTSLPPYPLT